jgi:hypothetical protein
MSVFSDFAAALRYMEHSDPEVFKLRSKIYMKPNEFTIEDAKELSAKYEHQNRRFLHLTGLLLNYLPEVQRLEAENEFMLRLINEHRIAE